MSALPYPIASQCDHCLRMVDDTRDLVAEVVYGYGTVELQCRRCRAPQRSRRLWLKRARWCLEDARRFAAEGNPDWTKEALLDAVDARLCARLCPRALTVPLAKTDPTTKPEPVKEAAL